MRAWKRVRFAGLCVIALVAGCGSLSKPYPVKESFGITAPAPARVGTTHAGVLRVERVRLTPPYDERTFVYRTSDTRYQSDYYAEFVADPGRLLTAELVRSLGAAGVFETVAEPDAGMDTAYRLETTVTELSADARDPLAPAATVRARFLLLHDGRDTTRVVGEWVIEGSERATDASPAAIAAAWGVALGRVTGELAERLSETPLVSATAR